MFGTVRFSNVKFFNEHSNVNATAYWLPGAPPAYLEAVCVPELSSLAGAVDFRKARSRFCHFLEVRFLSPLVVAIQKPLPHIPLPKYLTVLLVWGAGAGDNPGHHHQEAGRFGESFHAAPR